VLIAGGLAFGGIGVFFGSTSTAELYTPAVLVPAPVLLSTGDSTGQGAIVHAATGQLASPDNPAVAGEILAIPFTGLPDGSVIPPQLTIGGRLAEVLFIDVAPDTPGAGAVYVRMPSGVTPGPAVAVRLIYIGRTSNEVKLAAQ